jgi:nitroreductase
MQESILKAMNWRFATQAFDTTKPLEAEKLHTILEAGRLSPSSAGIEPWNFYVVENPEIRKQLGQQPKMTEAPALIVITYRTDAQQLIDENIARAAKTHDKTQEELQGFRDMQEGSANSKGENVVWWLKSQVYLPLGIMLEAAALLGVDGGPMEGFDPENVAKVLQLPANRKVAAMLALGYRLEGPARKKVRQSFDEAVVLVK